MSKTLPKFCKFVLFSIEDGYFNVSRFTSFKRKGKFPIFLRCILLKIFNPDGTVRENADALALRTIRQLCEYLYKLAVDTQVDVEDDFVTTDKEFVKSIDYQYVEQLRKDFCTYFREFHDSTIDHVIHTAPPRFGPGTFAGKNLYPHPWYFRKHFSELLPEPFQAWDWAVRKKAFGTRPPIMANDEVSFNELLTVPKDSRGPRTIVREPASLLRVQMSYNKFASKTLERLTSYRINFASQETNRLLARESSITREYATLDLSSASDRVSYRVICHIFRYSPLIRFFTTSTRTCRLSKGRTITLNKLSGMGSGLTFPTMSLLIYLSIVRSIVNTGVSYKRAMRDVYVYGDDIILPSMYYDIAVKSLEKVGLCVNTEKSFRSSHFRESCGGDYYDGIDVTPVRLKLANSSLYYNRGCIYFGNKCRDFFLLSLERHCRELIKAGLYRLANYYYNIIESHVGRLPWGTGDTPGLVRYRKDSDEVFARCDRDGTHIAVECYVPVPVRDSRWRKYESYLDYSSHLYSLLNRNSDPIYDDLIKWLADAQITGSAFGVVPRRVRLVKRLFSSLRLTY